MADDPGRARRRRQHQARRGPRPHRGDRVTFYLYSRPRVFTVSDVVPATGLAGSGWARPSTGTPSSRRASSRWPPWLPARSRRPLCSSRTRGGVEDGVDATRNVTRAIRAALGGLATRGALVTTPKREVLDAAEMTGEQLGFAVPLHRQLRDHRGDPAAGERVRHARRGAQRASWACCARWACAAGGYRRVRPRGRRSTPLSPPCSATGLGLLVGRVVVVVAVSILNAVRTGRQQAGHRLRRSSRPAWSTGCGRIPDRVPGRGAHQRAHRADEHHRGHPRPACRHVGAAASAAHPGVGRRDGAAGGRERSRRSRPAREPRPTCCPR